MNEARHRDVERRLWESLGLRPIERHVRLWRLETTARLQEVGDGPTILFVHGGSASGANWAPMIPHVAGYRCVLLDRPGCGLSAASGWDLGGLEALASFAEALVVDVLDALETPSAHVVSTSLGGYFALRGAAAHPDRVDRMVEFGYVVGAPMIHVPISMRAATFPGVRRLMTSIPPTRGATRAILRQLGLGPAMNDGRVSNELFEWFLSLLRDTPTLRHEAKLPRALLGTGQTNAGALPANVLAAVQCPLRFVWGESDPFGGREIAEPFVGRLPDAELELWPGSGHAPWIDDPELAAARVIDFLSD